MKRNLFAAMAILLVMSFGACSKTGDKSTASTTPGETSAKSNMEGDAAQTAEGEKSAKSSKEGDAKSDKSNKDGDEGANAAAAGAPDSAPKAP